MADGVAIRAMLVRLGLSAAAADFAAEEDGMGLNTLDDWCDCPCDSDLVSISKNLRSPGGGHVGFRVSVKVIGNLKIMRLALKQFRMIQRTVTPPEINMPWIENWRFLIEYHASAKEKRATEENVPKLNDKDWAKTFDIMYSTFSEVTGVGDAPLAYVIREDSDVLDEDEDDQEDYGGDTDLELIARAPHEGQHFIDDNKMVLKLIKKMCEDHPGSWSHVSKKTSGRAAWLALKQHYLGPQHVNLSAAIWESKMQHTHYSGESARFTFEKYCEIHQTAHSRLEALTEHGYHGVDEGTKIRRFLDGIQCAKLTTIVELCRGNKDFPTYEEVARRLKDSVVTLKPIRGPLKRNRGDRDIASVKTQGGGDPFPDVEADMDVEDKYYPAEVWSKLSKSKKKGVLLKRKKRKGKGGKNPKQGGEKDNKAVIANVVKEASKAFGKKVSALSRKISAIGIADEAEESSGSESSDQEEEQPRKKKQKTNNNRMNPALKPKSKKKTQI